MSDNNQDIWKRSNTHRNRRRSFAVQPSYQSDLAISPASNTPVDLIDWKIPRFYHMMIVISSSLACISLEQRKLNIPTSRNLKVSNYSLSLLPDGCCKSYGAAKASGLQNASLGSGSLHGYFIPPLSSCLSPEIADPAGKVGRTA
jgi:hypothetical protein